MRVTFIRHGETIGSVENRYDGIYDDSLSENGVEQSKTLANNLKDKGIDVIISSPLLRARETSQILSDQTKCEVIIEQSLIARNQFGVLTGMLMEEAKLKHPDLVELLKDRHNTIEGAEPYEDFSKRVVESFHKIIDNKEYQNIAVVTHGGALKVLCREFLKLGEITKADDCAYLELEKVGDTLMWVSHSGFEPHFETPTKHIKYL